MEWPVVLALVLVIPIILFPAALVWYLNIGGIYAAIMKARERRAARREEKAGNPAIVGRRVKAGAPAIGRATRIALRIAVPVGIYGLLIWFLLGSFGWEVALAVGLATPFMLIPVAFVWYLNVSGLYQVIRDRRQRQRRRAERIIRSRAVGTAAEERALAE